MTEDKIIKEMLEIDRDLRKIVNEAGMDFEDVMDVYWCIFGMNYAYDLIKTTYIKFERKTFDSLSEEQKADFERGLEDANNRYFVNKTKFEQLAEENNEIINDVTRLINSDCFQNVMVRFLKTSKEALIFCNENKKEINVLVDELKKKVTEKRISEIGGE